MPRLNRSDTARSIVSWTEHNKHADLNHLKSLDWADSIGLIHKRFEKTPVKFQDPRTAEALRLLGQQAASKQHFIAFMVTLYRAGFRGVEASQELICDAVSRTTQAYMFGVRTLRNAASWAIAEGFITQSWQPIGKRAIKENGDYCTIRIRRYTATYKIRLLVAALRADPRKYRPDLAIVPHGPTPEKISSNPSGEQAEGLIKSPSAMLLRLDDIKDDQAQASNSMLTGNEEAASAAVSTCPPRQASATCKHRTTQKRRLKNEPRQFQRSDRAASPQTYRQSRRHFLHELFIRLKPGSSTAEPDAVELYQIAELQTDPFYPRFLPIALDWYAILLENFFADWHERRRQIDLIVLPSLRIFAKAWTPPQIDFEKQKNAMQIVDRWQMSLCPEPGIAVLPERLQAYFKAWPCVRALLSGIHAGQINAAELFKTGSLALRFCNFFIYQ